MNSAERRCLKLKKNENNHRSCCAGNGNPEQLQHERYLCSPLFEDITAEDMQKLMGCMKGFRRSHHKGEIILMEDETVQYIGVILKGTIHMVKEDIWGGKTILAYMQQNEIFGETFVVQRDNHSDVSFVAATECEVLYLSFDHILHTCMNQCMFHHILIENLFRLMGEKNGQLMEKIQVTSQSTLRNKILKYLSIQSQKQKSRYITLSLNRTEMANYLSTNRSSMTRELSAMREEGLLDYDRNTFVLKNPPRKNE